MIKLLVIAAALMSPGAAPSITIRPRDQCAADASFVAFRAAMKRAIQAKDVKALLAMTTPDIAWSLVEEDGRAGFVKQWGLSRPGSSMLWATLERTLSRGCALDGKAASAPWLYGNGPDGDPVLSGVVSGERVNVREAPMPGARVLSQLSWQVVGLGKGGWKNGFTEIVLADGTLGYVADDYLWTIWSHRALFRKINGKWMMNAFVAGD